MAEYKVVGIDPGKDGAVALVGAGGILLKTWKVPKVGKEYDEVGMVQLIARAVGMGARSAVIEAIFIGPVVGRKTLLQMGVGHGLWRGAFSAAGLGYEIIRPQVWEAGIPGRVNSVGKAKTGEDLKRVLIVEAVRRWPKIEQHSGVCDAALIAEFQRRRLVGGEDAQAALAEIDRGEG